MSSRIPGPRCFAAPLALFILACGPSVPAEITYRLTVVVESAEPGSMAGWEVLLDGEPVGELSRAGALELTRPSATRPSALTFALRAATICGELSVPLEPRLAPDADSDEAIARHMQDGAVPIRVELTGVPGGAHPILVDWGESAAAALRVGDATLESGASRSMVLAEGCENTAPVRLGDETIGTWRASSAVTFVAVDADACHELRTVGYGDAVAGNATVIGQRVRALEREPTTFLEEAPRAVSSTGSEEYRSQLTRTQCPDRSWSTVGGQLAEAQRCGEAILALRRATRFDQSDVASWRHLVGCLAESSRGSEALEEARAALEHNPDEGGLRDTLATTLREAGLEAQAARL